MIAAHRVADALGGEKVLAIAYVTTPRWIESSTMACRSPPFGQ
jgi:hypothetical protein